MRGLRQLSHCTCFEPIMCIPACMPFLWQTLPLQSALSESGMRRSGWEELLEPVPLGVGEIAWIEGRHAVQRRPCRPCPSQQNTLLENAIYKAIDGGWAAPGRFDEIDTLSSYFIWSDPEDNDDYPIGFRREEIIFNHDFAKARWGDEPIEVCPDDP